MADKQQTDKTDTVAQWDKQTDRQTGKQNARIAKAFASAKAKHQTGWPNDKIDKYSLYSRATYVCGTYVHRRPLAAIGEQELPFGSPIVVFNFGVCLCVCMSLCVCG